MIDFIDALISSYYFSLSLRREIELLFRTFLYISFRFVLLLRQLISLFLLAIPSEIPSEISRNTTLDAHRFFSSARLYFYSFHYSAS